MVCGCGNKNCKSPGKHPISNIVANGHNGATNDYDTLISWFSRYPSANIGLNLAKSGLVAIDIDPRNGGDHTFESLEAKHGKITSNTEQLTGGGGTHIIYAASAGGRYPGTLGDGIDVKHNGYIMVWPSNHISGGTYEWEGSSDLLAGNIPSPAPEWLKANQALTSSYSPPITTPIDYDEDELRSALSKISSDDYHSWINVGIAIHNTDPTDKGFKLWDEWSRQSKKYDAKATAKRWHGLGGQNSMLTKASIFHWAMSGGWKNPAKKEEPKEIKDKVAEIFAAAVSVLYPDEVEVYDHVPTQVKPFPVNAINDLADIISRSAMHSNPQASQIGALMIASLAASRRYYSDDGIGTHMYLSVVTDNPPDYLYNAIESILDILKMHRKVTSSRLTTTLALIDGLARNPYMLHLAGDIGGLLSNAKRMQANGAQMDAINKVQSIYNKNRIFLDVDTVDFIRKRIPVDDSPKADGAKDPMEIIHDPALSLLGHFCRDSLQAILKSSEVGSGILVNTAVCVTDSRINQRNAKQTPITSLPTEIVAAFNAVRGLDGNDLQKSMESNPWLPASKIIVSSDNVDFAKYDAKLMALTDRERLIPIVIGAMILMRKIALTLAAWSCPANPKYDDEIVESSYHFVSGETSKFLDEFRIMETGEGEKATIYQMALKHIIDSGNEGLSLQQLRDKCYAFKKLPLEKRREILIALKDDDEIDHVKTGKKEVYMAKRFIKSKKPR